MIAALVFAGTKANTDSLSFLLTDVGKVLLSTTLSQSERIRLGVQVSLVVTHSKLQRKRQDQYCIVLAALELLLLTDSAGDGNEWSLTVLSTSLA